MSSLISRLFSRPDAPAGAAPAAAAPAAVPMAATAAPAPGLVGDFLFEEQVNAGKLLSLFRQAFLEVEVAGEERLRLRAETGMRLSAFVDRERKLIAFCATYSLSAEAPMADKIAFANRVNDRLILVRFAISDATTLCIDYQLPFDGGVASASVLGALRRLTRIANSALSELDTDRVLG